MFSPATPEKYILKDKILREFQRLISSGKICGMYYDCDNNGQVIVSRLRQLKKVYFKSGNELNKKLVINQYISTVSIDELNKAFKNTNARWVEMEGKFKPYCNITIPANFIEWEYEYQGEFKKFN